jgi:hypothetical protein
MLDGVSVVDAFHRAVYPPEAKSNFHGINIPYHSRTVCRGPVHPQPETTDFVVILLIPPVQLLAGVYVKQVSYVHYDPAGYSNAIFVSNIRNLFFDFNLK